MHSRTLLLLAAALSSLTGACAPTPEPSTWQPSASVFSSPSSPSVTSYSVQPSAPHQIRIDADLIVRPDQACLPLAVVTHHVDVDAALAAAKAAIADVTARSGGTVRIDDLRTDTVEVAGDADAEPVRYHRVVITAVVERALVDDDVFARSAVVAHLVDSLRLHLRLPRIRETERHVDEAVGVATKTTREGTPEDLP